MRARYSFRSDWEHTVIVNRYRREHADLRLRGQQSEIEGSYGVTPAPIRFGLTGMPRVERKVADFLDGAARSSNRDIQVVCWSLRPTGTAPPDERVAIAESWRYVDDDEVSRGLAMCDLIAIPNAPDGEMLTTGVVGDEVGMGLGMLISSWKFLTETAAEAAILCGHTTDEIAESLDRLTIDDVIRAKQASMRLREDRHWDQARTPLLEFYGRVQTK